MARKDKPARQMTATQTLKGLKPVLTSNEGERWLQDIRDGLELVMREDDFDDHPKSITPAGEASRLIRRKEGFGLRR